MGFYAITYVYIIAQMGTFNLTFLPDVLTVLLFWLDVVTEVCLYCAIFKLCRAVVRLHSLF
jgi:hypothetical protein